MLFMSRKTSCASFQLGTCLFLHFPGLSESKTFKTRIPSPIASCLSVVRSLRKGSHCLEKEPSEHQTMETTINTQIDGTSHVSFIVVYFPFQIKNIALNLRKILKILLPLIKFFNQL